MALELSLSIEERNDSKAITFTDNSGVYDLNNTTGWGSPNLDVGAITTLTLDVSINSESRPQINLVTEFSLDGSSTYGDLIFLITNEILGYGSDDELPDGVYDITYTVDEGLQTESVVTYQILIDGVVRNTVYDLLRRIPFKYTYGDCKAKDIMDALFAYSYLKAIENSAYVARIEELNINLELLQRICYNGSNYNWKSC